MSVSQGEAHDAKRSYHPHSAVCAARCVYESLCLNIVFVPPTYLHDPMGCVRDGDVIRPGSLFVFVHISFRLPMLSKRTAPVWVPVSFCNCFIAGSAMSPVIKKAILLIDTDTICQQLKSHFEEHDYAFYAMTAMSFAASVGAAWFGVYRYAARPVHAITRWHFTCVRVGYPRFARSGCPTTIANGRRSDGNYFHYERGDTTAAGHELITTPARSKSSPLMITLRPGLPLLFFPMTQPCHHAHRDHSPFTPACYLLTQHYCRLPACIMYTTPHRVARCHFACPCTQQCAALD